MDRGNNIPVGDNVPSNVPPLQTGQELLSADENFLASENWWREDIKDCMLDFTEAYTPPKWTLSNCGIPFAPLGDLYGISGKTGNGKSWSVVLFMATILKGEIGTLKCELPPEIRRSICYIDTEQSKDITITIKHRVCQLCGHNPQEPWDRFQIARLRDCETPGQRWRKLLKIVYEIRPTILFLDGVLDVLGDFNDNKECARVINMLMALCTRYQMSICCVLHENPTSEKMIGHAGSTLIRKASDIFKCMKKEGGSDIHFELTQIKCRGRDAPPLKFRTLPVDDFGRLELIDETPDIDMKGDIDFVSDMGEWLQQAIDDNYLTIPCTLAEVKSVLKNYGGVTNADKLQRDVVALRNRRVLIEQPREEWLVGQKHPKFNVDLT